ncbi:MAG: T9SS type A sorting domain-containing protein [Bacteroidota bacterium]
MRKLFTFILAFASLASFAQLGTITSVANGNWKTPATWDCNCVPTSLYNVVVNHTVTLDTNHAVGFSLTIGSAGTLQASSPTINLAVYSGTLTNNGTVSVYNFATNSGATLTNNKTFGALNYLNDGTLNNSSTGELMTNSLANSGILNNSGIITTTDIHNSGSGTNNNILSFVNMTNRGVFNNFSEMNGTVDFTNANLFDNKSGAELNIGNNFSNMGCIDGSIIFTNNGTVNINNNFANGDSIQGTTGNFNVKMNSINLGFFIGTFNFCDSTPPLFTPYIDMNIGNIATGITYCNTLKVNNPDESNKIEVHVFPNPFSDQATISIRNIDFSSSKTYKFELFDINGKSVLSHANCQQNEISISKGNLRPGTYFYRIIIKNKQVYNGKIIVQ